MTSGSVLQAFAWSTDPIAVMPRGLAGLRRRHLACLLLLLQEPQEPLG
jgi:hypothetical protein